jgi:hypothetical protein
LRFFRHYLHGLLLAYKRLTQLNRGYVFSNFMYVVLQTYTLRLFVVPYLVHYVDHCIHQVYKDRNIVWQLVKRAEVAGFKAIALTVDTTRLGRREVDIKNRSNIEHMCTLSCLT